MPVELADLRITYLLKSLGMLLSVKMGNFCLILPCCWYFFRGTHKDARTNIHALHYTQVKLLIISTKDLTCFFLVTLTSHNGATLFQ